MLTMIMPLSVASLVRIKPFFFEETLPEPNVFKQQPLSQVHEAQQKQHFVVYPETESEE